MWENLLLELGLFLARRFWKSAQFQAGLAALQEKDTEARTPQEKLSVAKDIQNLIGK